MISKSNLMDFGELRGRTQWLLSWVEYVESLSVISIILTPDRAEIPDMNRGSQLSKFQRTLQGWSSRVLDMVEERAFVLDTFVLSKIVYRAQIIQMSDRWVKKFEKEIDDFLWRGNVSKHAVKRDFVSLPKSIGGLGLTRLRLKTNSLLRRLCFMMLAAEGNRRRHLNFWIGGRMRCNLVPDVFHHVRQVRRRVADTTAPLFVEYLNLYEMGRLGEWFNLYDPDTSTTEALYGARCSCSQTLMCS